MCFSISGKVTIPVLKTNPDNIVKIRAHIKHPINTNYEDKRVRKNCQETNIMNDLLTVFVLSNKHFNSPTVIRCYFVLTSFLSLAFSLVIIQESDKT